MKLVTEEDIFHALIISKKEHSLIGTTLVNMGLITLEQLETALKLQLDFDTKAEKQYTEKNKEQRMANNNLQTKKIGEILVEMKLATEQDVWNALVISKKSGSLIGSTLVNMGIITLEQLKSVLKLQLGFDTVTEEQISSINQNVLSIFPEDFIKIYKFIPLSSDGKNISVGMVNPNDKSAIDNIVLFSGMKPVIYILTYFEYEKLIQKLFKE